MYGFVNDFNDKISVIITLNFSNKYIMLPNIIKNMIRKDLYQDYFVIFR